MRWPFRSSLVAVRKRWTRGLDCDDPWDEFGAKSICAPAARDIFTHALANYNGRSGLAEEIKHRVLGCCLAHPIGRSTRDQGLHVPIKHWVTAYPITENTESQRTAHATI